MQVSLYTDINNSNWSMSAYTDGAVVEGNRDLAQQVMNALAINKGSVPFDPELGFNVQLLLDRPVNFVIPNGKLGILDAIEYAVPLVTVDRVDHEFLATDPSHVIFIVYCSSNLGNFGVAISTSPNFTPQTGMGAFSSGFSTGFNI